MPLTDCSTQTSNDVLRLVSSSRGRHGLCKLLARFQLTVHILGLCRLCFTVVAKKVTPDFNSMLGVPFLAMAFEKLRARCIGFHTNCDQIQF